MLLNKNVASVAVTSNGFLPEKISELEPVIIGSKKGIQLTISLDGLEETHNEIRGVANVFKNVVKSCEIAKNLSLKYPKFKFAVNIVLMRENIGEIEKLVDFLELKGYSSLFTPVRGNSFSSFNLDKEIEIKDYGPKVANQLSLDEIENSVSVVSKKYPRYFLGMNKKLLDLIIKTLRAKKRQIRCYAGYESAVIYSSGLVSVCEQVKPFGDLKDWDYNILNAWNSKEADLHRQKTLSCACTHTCNLYNSLEIEQNKQFSAVIKKKIITAYKHFKFADKIESKRDSKKRFWKIVIYAKDLFFKKFFD
jgi:MoaA/NifB/PqqE/SkfB family radical SAM enzyme